MRLPFKSRPTVAEKRRFADLQDMRPEQRHAALAGADSAGWIEAAAIYGLVEAQVLLGQRILPSDPRLALGWFRAAAASGYPPALNMVGRCFEKGWGTAPDPEAAARHYRTAAEQGLDWAQFNLASLLLYGIGVPRDRVAAYGWFRRAAAQDHAKAMNMLGRFYEEGWDRPADHEAAIAWYRQAALGGDYRGQFNLGTILFQQGEAASAAKWFEAALETGDPDFVAQASATLLGSPDPAHRALGQKYSAFKPRRAAGRA